MNFKTKLKDIRSHLDSGNIDNAHQLIVDSLVLNPPKNVRLALIGELFLESWYRKVPNLMSLISELPEGGEYCYFVILTFLELNMKDKAENHLNSVKKEFTKKKKDLTLKIDKLWLMLIEGKLEEQKENIGKAEKLFTEIWENSNLSNNFLKICTGLELFNLFIRKYQFSADNKSFIKSKEILSEILRISKDKYNVMHIKVQLKRVQYASIQLDFDKTRLYLEEALEYSKKYPQLNFMTKEIKNNVDKINKRFSAVMRGSAKQVLLGSSNIEPTESVHSYIDLNNYKLVAYELIPKMPAQLIVEQELPFKESAEILNATGIYLSIAIGHGESYNTGFFGPLPLPLKSNIALEQNYSVLLYSADYSNYKSFPKENSFLLFCLIFPNELSSTLPSRNWSETVFSTINFNVIQKREDITKELIEKMKYLLFSQKM